MAVCEIPLRFCFVLVPCYIPTPSSIQDRVRTGWGNIQSCTRSETLGFATKLLVFLDARFVVMIITGGPDKFRGDPEEFEVKSDDIGDAGK